MDDYDFEFIELEDVTQYKQKTTRTNYLLPFKVPNEFVDTFKDVLNNLVGNPYPQDELKLTPLVKSVNEMEKSEEYLYEALRRTLNYHCDDPLYYQCNTFLKMTKGEFPFKIPGHHIIEFKKLLKSFDPQCPDSLYDAEIRLRGFYFSQGIMYEILRQVLNSDHNKKVLRSLYLSRGFTSRLSMPL